MGSGPTGLRPHLTHTHKPTLVPGSLGPGPHWPPCVCGPIYMGRGPYCPPVCMLYISRERERERERENPTQTWQRPICRATGHQVGCWQKAWQVQGRSLLHKLRHDQVGGWKLHWHLHWNLQGGDRNRQRLVQVRKSIAVLLGRAAFFARCPGPSQFWDREYIWHRKRCHTGGHPHVLHQTLAKGMCPQGHPISPRWTNVLKHLQI